MVASLRQSISGKWYVTLECECCMSNSGVGGVPGRLSSVGLCNTPPLPSQSIPFHSLPNRLANCPVFASRISGHKLKYRT